jgi:signal transduction histidine kinase
MQDNKIGIMTDTRISKFRRAAAAFRQHEFGAEIPVGPLDEVGLLGQELSSLGQELGKQFEQMQILLQITGQINSGLVLDEVLNQVYTSFRPLLPYDRIGFSLLEENNRVVRATWTKSEAEDVRIAPGFEQRLEGSSLQQVIETGRPRIINDLKEYLGRNPGSVSTKLIVAEGMRSSLTCPLLALGKPIGFMFFSSMQPRTYQDVHIEIFQQIAGQLALIVEKGRLYQKLLELNQLKNKFLGIAAHDLRGPLSVIQKFAEVLLEDLIGPTSEQQKDMLRRIARVSENTYLLVSDLLDVSTIESGQLKIDFQLTDLPSFLGGVYEAHRILAQAKKMELVLEVPQGLPPLSMDPERITQVLNNLITNAIKFSQPHTTIILRAALSDKGVEIAVEDQGPGIPEEELPKIFKDFGKTSVRPTAGERSTGLGLAIARRVTEAHGGRLTVRSQVGKGSVFTLHLGAGGQPVS